MNAGEPGHIFAGKYKPFSVRRTFQMIGVYIIDGLSPTPELTRKMKPQSKERTHGNDFIAQHIGPGYQQMYRTFRHFFACQDPLTNPPPAHECPNYKVDEFHRWLRYIMPQAWNLSKNFSVDEQTCKMQGKSIHKTRCGKYKRLGDGIQCDAIADDGYTYDFYFRSEPVDKKWLSMGLSCTHARLMHMYSKLKDVGHENKMDNLFNSVNLARHTYSLPQKVKIHGVIRKSGRGVPACVFQEDVKGKEADARRGTVKVALLKGDTKSSDLIVASCFDQKPFYTITHSDTEVSWIEVTRQLWSTVLRRNVLHTFLCWSLEDEYNYEMNDNDIADQLRLVYRIQRFQRNYKWWWALWVWAIEITIVNAYMMYRRFCELKGVTQIYCHHDFREAIGYALIDPVGEWPRRKSPSGPPRKKQKRAESTKAPSLNTESTRAPRLNTCALSPGRGRMKKRLETSLGHYPCLPVGKKQHRVCQLHRWAHSEKGGDNEIPSGARLNVFECLACRVKLCIPCFRIYHECSDLGEKIDEILYSN